MRLEGGKKPNQASNNSRLIVSQDRHQIFVTFASCPQAYFSYIDRENREATNDAFLTMQRFGPWRIDNHQDMRHFAQLIVAITLVCKQTT